LFALLAITASLNFFVIIDYSEFIIVVFVIIFVRKTTSTQNCRSRSRSSTRHEEAERSSSGASIGCEALQSNHWGVPLHLQVQGGPK